MVRLSPQENHSRSKRKPQENRAVPYPRLRLPVLEAGRFRAALSLLAGTGCLLALGAFAEPTDSKRSVETSTSGRPGAASAPAKAARQDFRFYTAEKRWNPETQRYSFYRVGRHGAERVLRGGFRRYFLSENQAEYPVPESGCGPVALLNLYIWYSKFGLIKESSMEPDPERYKQLKFREIDARLEKILGQTRSPERGTNRLEQVLALDELLKNDSDVPVRLHFEFKEPPLSYRDFIRISRNYRAGILTVQPKDPSTGEILGYHAVLAVRGDRSGTVTLANWGGFTHGRLVSRKDGQWFVPQDQSEFEFRIVQMTTLIPFTPIPQ